MGYQCTLLHREGTGLPPGSLPFPKFSLYGTNPHRGSLAFISKGYVYGLLMTTLYSDITVVCVSTFSQ